MLRIFRTQPRDIAGFRTFAAALPWPAGISLWLAGAAGDEFSPIITGLSARSALFLHWGGLDLIALRPGLGGNPFLKKLSQNAFLAL